MFCNKKWRFWASFVAIRPGQLLANRATVELFEDCVIMAFLTLQISYLKLNKSRSGEEEFDNFLRRRTMRRLLWSLTKVKQAKRVGQTERGVLSKSADPNGKFWLISGDCNGTKTSASGNYQVVCTAVAAENRSSKKKRTEEPPHQPTSSRSPPNQIISILILLVVFNKPSPRLWSLRNGEQIKTGRNTSHAYRFELKILERIKCSPSL